MDGVPAPFPAAGPGVLELTSASASLRRSAVNYANLSPLHWRSPSASGYRSQVHELVAAAHRAAGQLDRARLAAQQHAAELEYVRQALLGGNPVPR